MNEGCIGLVVLLLIALFAMVGSCDSIKSPVGGTVDSKGELK